MSTHPDPTVERWAALRTSARWEKKVADELAAAGVPVFLPLVRRVSDYRGKRHEADVPLFGGYVFCGEGEFLGNPRVPSGCRARVAQVLRTSDQNQLRTELAALGELLTDRRLVQERVAGRVGDVVRVVGGPFRGTEAVIRQLDPTGRKIVLGVGLLGACVEVIVDEGMVERSGPAA